MSFKEKGELIGKKSQIAVGSIKVDVKVLDYKYTYGRDRWLVKPVAGSGEMWTESFVK